jgi:hypothetical protein
MGTFDNISDVQGQLKAEGMNMTLTFQPGVPNVGQGTITWNIPGPVEESVDANGDVQVTMEPTGVNVDYSGIVLVLRNQPVDYTNIPCDGRLYTPDPTADPRMFSGDRIGDGLVIGAVYDSEAKAQGLPLTTSIVINDVDANTPYYICGYICDDQLRYYTEGIRAYSDKLGRKDQLGTHAQQVIQLGPNAVTGRYGVSPTDGTGLIAGAIYQFEIIYDCNFPRKLERREDNKYRRYIFISINGADAPTYADLIKQINQQIAIQCTDAAQSPVPPGAGVYYWNATTQTLYQWNGMQLNVVPNTIVSGTDPAIPVLNSYWWNTTNDQLYQWNGSAYQIVTPQLEYPTDPTQITGPNDYWYNPASGVGYQRDGNTWCQVESYNTVTDPSCAVVPQQGSYWYDTTNSILYAWVDNQWVQTFALMWTSPPNALPVGSYWYDLNTNTVNNRQQQGPMATVTITNGGIGYGISGTYTNVPLVGGKGTNAQATVVVAGGEITSVTITNPGTGYFVTDLLTVSNLSVGGIGNLFTATVATVTGTTYGWQSQPFINSTTDPTLVLGNGVIAGTLWYNPTTEVLNLRDSTNVFWIVTPILVWAGDPTVISSCELWWNESTVPPTLNVWNTTTNTWVPVLAFYNQATDPSAEPILATGTLWYNPTVNALFYWNGSSWVQTQDDEFITTFDPTIPVNGEGWLNTTTNTWNVWGIPLANQWNPITPISDGVDPSMPAQGSFWFDTTNNILYTRIGTMWIPVPYVTTAPFNKKYQTWYNSTTNQLMQWNGTAWVHIPPSVYCKLEMGSIVFRTVGRGSNHVLFVPIPAGVVNMNSPCVLFGTGSADYWNDSNSPYDSFAFGGGPGFYVGSPGYTDGIPGFIDGSIANGPYGSYDNANQYYGGFDGWNFNCFCNYAGEGGVGNYPAVPINPNAFLFAKLTPVGIMAFPQPGGDGIAGTPSTDIIGVGTDGSPEERRKIMQIVRVELGYPSVQVELDDTQLDRCVQNALNVFRQKSSMAYKRAAFFLDIVPFKQNYVLANKAVGFNKIVSVMAAYRFTSAFLSSAMGAGVYGQVVLQHLYNMGTFDLLSYHLVSQYVENLEIMFSTRLVFVFDEYSRELNIYQTFNRPERILLDVTVERTEQDIFSNRYSKRWIQQYAKAEGMEMLAQIRGKFANLPGAGGAVTLNVSDLNTKANDIKTALQQELDDQIVQNSEDFGAYGIIAIG